MHSLRAALVCFLLALVCLAMMVNPARGDDSWMIVAGNAADLASTEYALSVNPAAREGNPLLRDQAVRVAIKAAATAALVYVYKRVKKKDEKKARVLAVVVGCAFVSVAAWNVAQAHR